MATEDWQFGGFGLYVHWPFCEAKCPYCDFNSHVTQNIDQTIWADALAREVRRVADLTPGRVLNSIFFGGGTPSLMEAATVQKILGAAQETWTWANDIEITLEANPRSVEAARFEGYAEAGVNRVSLGVQALRAEDLRRLGRLHDVHEAKTAFDIARSVFDRVSFDLIYARQGQSLSDWEVELGEALSMSVDHLSLYQLTIEQGTAFGDRYNAGRLKGLPDEDLAADMYEVTQALCSAAGLPSYEVSNHARPGSESRHNLIYWNYGDYAGVGPGAHGRLTQNGQKFATVAASAPGKWLDLVKDGRGDTLMNAVGPEEQVAEYLMMGLRLLDGVDLVRLYNMSNYRISDQTIADLLDLDLIWKTETALGVTPKGRMILNAVVSELIP
ncbi:radical SAM family heme chaperone HemW [Primorskyibacter sp. 2E107]|uniref:radical SAM family heme chaperone HemW n=1 Tax=Primorskyibacter sp. 2E107 TaxID=3403458 RepID=UPI003AF7DAD4